MTSKLPELLECPFCGETKYLHYPIGEVRTYYTECQSCNAMGPQFAKQGKEEAITAWNTRHHSASRDRAIARAAWEKCSTAFFSSDPSVSFMAADDYLQSDEFLSLIGEKKHGA
jgi:Lar family restriction alleviation protein